MSPKLYRILTLLGLLGLLFACTREAEQGGVDLLQQVPAETPYVFVTSRHLPDKLRTKLADHNAAQLGAQRAAFARLREQLEGTEDTAPLAHQAAQLFDVLDALFSEFDDRTTADSIRELGIEPVTRSVVYGIGLLPATRIEISDAGKVNALLDRVEQRAAVAAQRGDLNGQAYRRIDLGQVDAVLAVTEQQLVAGLLLDARFDTDLPLLLGQQAPPRSLADAGDIQALIERHKFTGFGEGFIKLDEIVATMLGKGQGRNAQLMQALGASPVPMSDGCMRMTEGLVAGMPRMVMGISQADERRIAVRGVWESSPAVAGYLQKLAAPVPGVGDSGFDGLLAFGMGLDLPQLRNAIDALLRQVMAAGATCEWVDEAKLEAVIPQLNLALGPMTAGIKGFSLQIDDLSIDPDTLQPAAVRAGLLAAVDDPRGILALGAMFNPGLAALDIPADGSLVDLPSGLGLEEQTPPLKVAIKDKALLLVAGADSAEIVGPLLDAVPLSPARLFAVDYGVYRLVERFGGVMQQAADRLDEQGEATMAQEIKDQLQVFRLQAQLFERLRISVHASADGLVMDQVMELR